MESTTLHFDNARAAAALYQNDERLLREMEQRLGVQIAVGDIGQVLGRVRLQLLHEHALGGDPPLHGHADRDRLGLLRVAVRLLLGKLNTSDAQRPYVRFDVIRHVFVRFASDYFGRHPIWCAYKRTSSLQLI